MEKTEEGPTTTTEGSESESDPEVFRFGALPIELKHEVLGWLSVGFLEDVCASVCVEWKGIVEDVVSKRVTKVLPTIPSHILLELKNRNILEPPENYATKAIRIYERSLLRAKFDVTSILVNKDVMSSNTGIIYKVWKNRPCDCSQLDECIVRSIHLMSCLDLLVVQSTRELQFYHITDLERVGGLNVKEESVLKYSCTFEDSWFENSSGTDISVLKDQIVAEEKARTILLLKASSCNHENRSLKLERLRRIHLPIWSSSLCLMEDKFYVLYSTGFVGMWDREADELSISPNVCGMQRDNHQNLLLHTSKMYKVGKLVFIKTILTDDSSQWHVIDSDDDCMEIHVVPMNELVTTGFLKDDTSLECVEVCFVELWYNCFIVHSKVRSLIPEAAQPEFRLLIKRIQRYPQLQDFKECSETFSKNFLSDTECCKSVELNGSVIPAFLPLSIKPPMLEPRAEEPIPVADMIAVHWPYDRPRKRRKLKVYRVRISNLPFSFQE